MIGRACRPAYVRRIKARHAEHGPWPRANFTARLTSLQLKHEDVCMTPDTSILYAVDAGVATLTFNRPEKLNALTPQMLERFFSCVSKAAADPEVRVIVVTGAGRGFSAGLDLSVIGTGQSGHSAEPAEAPPPSQWGDDVGPSLQRYFSGGWNALITSRKPTIAAVNGAAFGWGFILSLHCDIRFAARSALFNATFARLGVPAEKGIGWLLPRLIGTARAADLLYTARRFDGVEAERLGIVNAVLDDDQLMAHVSAYAQSIAANAAPRALAAMKAQIWTATDDHYDEGFAAANLEQDLCTKTEDFREGLASYKDKRAPRFTGR
jgi:enoyl-CoA hydratase/carnithine racemase